MRGGKDRRELRAQQGFLQVETAFVLVILDLHNMCHSEAFAGLHGKPIPVVLFAHSGGLVPQLG